MLDEEDFARFARRGRPRWHARSYRGHPGGFFSGTLQKNDEALSVLSDEAAAPVPVTMEMK